VTQTDDQSEVAADPVGVVAMTAGDQAWTDNRRGPTSCGTSWPPTRTRRPDYGETIKTLVYLMMAGDYWAPTSSPVPAVGRHA